MTKKKYFTLALVFLMAVLFFPVLVFAEDSGTEKENNAGDGVTGGMKEEAETAQWENDVMDMILEELEFGEVEEVMESIFPGQKVTFRTVLGKLLEGDVKEAAVLVGNVVRDRLLYEIDVNRMSVIRILLIAITAAVLTNFSGLVKNRHISDISFYMLYLLLITICVSSFELVTKSVAERLGLLTEFVKVLAPVYFLSVAFSSGVTTSVMFYHIVLVLIYIVELLVIRFLLPVIHVYIMVKVLEHLTEEDYLSKFAELLEIVIQWTMRIVLTGVIGLNVIQGLLGPAIDSAGRNVLVRGVEMIPGIGDVAGGIGQTVIGTAVLIKNGIGAGALIICILICLVPVIQMAVMTLMYKVAAAMIQPMSDKRIVECISGIGEGFRMLLRVVVNSAVLFLITIAIVAAATS